MAGPDLSVFGKLRSFNDYQRMQEEFEAQKAAQEQAAQLNALQMQKVQKDLNSTDLKGLAEQSLFAYHQGQPLTSEGRAALETLASLEGNKTTYEPDELGTVRAVTRPNPFQQFLGSSGSAMPSPVGGDPIAASRQAIAQRTNEIGGNPYQDDLGIQPMDLAGIEQMMGSSPALNMPVKGAKPASDLSGMAFDPQYAPNLDPQVASSAFGRKAIFEKQLKLMEDMNNPATEIGKMQLDEKRGLVPAGSTENLIKEKTRQTRKEDMALEAQEKAAKEAEKQEADTKSVAQKKVNEAVGILKKHYFASGRGATAALMVPGRATKADVLNSAYGTLKSTISLEAMMKLKEASPTGSTGFGALNTNELKILTDKLGELDAELPMEAQLENLRTIANILKLDIPELTQTGGAGNVQSLIDKYAN
jgi:hypothetical protein